MPRLEVRNLNKKFKQRRGGLNFILHPFEHNYKDILKNISFSIDRNGIFSLVGPNGSGKSTLLRILCGILLPDSGEVVIDDTPISIDPHKVFLISDSEKGFYPRLSLINNLRFFLALINDKDITRKNNLSKIVEEFGLEKEQDTRFQELSTGTKQRLAIARAMLFDPQILLLDEITKGVDIAQQQTIYTLLHRLKERGKILIFATHVMDEIANLSDMVILIQNGNLLGFGEYSQIKDQIKQVFNIK